MAAPRLEVSDTAGTAPTGNPILDSANALNNDNSILNNNNSINSTASLPLEKNRPSQSSPLRSASTTAADLDHPQTVTQQQQPQQGDEPVENVLSAIGGAAVAAPLAALEAVSKKIPGLVEVAKQQTATLASNISSNETVASTSESSRATLDNAKAGITSTATNLANQASTYVQQAIDSLPESISSKLPAQVANLGTGAGASAGPSHHEEMPLGSESRETTSAPILDAREQRPQAVLKAPVAGAGADGVIVGQGNNAVPSATASGADDDDFTKPHTTGNFEASGSLQATQNPELLEAQSDLAVRAENGDI